MDSPHTTRLESAALATLAAQQFTSTATRQRATVNFKGLRLRRVMRAHYSLAPVAVHAGRAQIRGRAEVEGGAGSRA